jgi:predicted enzyme related to lactoylglutathione lyase
MLGRIVLYVHDVDAVTRFYERHFGFVITRKEGDRIVELSMPSGGASLMLHPAAKSQKKGQSLVKLVFDVSDVETFRRDAQAQGLDFGPLHAAEGYVFCNGRDPAGNPIQISSRAFR